MVSGLARAGDDSAERYGEPEVPIPRGIAEVMAPRLLHDAVTEGRQGSAISITVAVESDLRFDKIVLAYRRGGAKEFLGRQMREAGSGSYATEIPPAANGGAEVAYFIEAQDKDGRVVATRGSLEKPFVIKLFPADQPEVTKAQEEAARADADDQVEIHVDLAKLKWLVGLVVGRGFGWAAGNGDLNADVRVDHAGFVAASLGHIAPEAGIWVGRGLVFSLQGRLQRIVGTTDVNAGGRTFHSANYAAALFAKATWIFGRGRLQPTFSLAAGLGRIRHVVTFAGLTDCGASHSETCVDTVAGGPVLAGAGGGLLYQLNHRLLLVAQVNSQLGTPDFTLNVDLGLGVAAKF
jgi:hypothetical protein